MTDVQHVGNKTISRFVGNKPQFKKAMKYYKNEIAGGFPDYTGLKYHESYDWLMPVAKMLIDSDYDESIDLDDLMNAGGRFDISEVFIEVVSAIVDYETTV